MPPKRARGAADHVGSVDAAAEESALAARLFGAAPEVVVSGLGSGGASSVSGSGAPVAASRGAAWADEDDAALTVDLRGTSRLRKLRETLDEGTIDGAAYTARLRGRFAAMAESSGAANSSWAQQRHARRRSGDGEAAGDNESDGENENEGLPDSLDDVEGADAVATVGGLTQASTALPADALAVSRLRDANVRDPARSTVRAIAWHPTPGTGILAVASHDERLRFFRTDGVANTALACVRMHDMPIYSVGWTGDGAEVIATGRRPFFYVYDVSGGKVSRVPRLLGRDEASLESAVVSPGDPCSTTSLIAFLGNDGTTILASARSKQWIGNLKMPAGSVRAAAFSRGPTGGGGGAGALEYPELATVGSHGELCRWDLRTMKLLSRTRDEGSTGCTALAAHPSGSTYAVGQSLGVVNVYDVGALDRAASAGVRSASGVFAPPPGAPKPSKTYLNLTLAVDNLTYGGPAGELLLMSSSRARDTLKIAHTRTGGVFANWPTARTPLATVTGGAVVSPGGGYLAVGNDRGRVLLYRLNHFAQV